MNEKKFIYKMNYLKNNDFFNEQNYLNDNFIINVNHRNLALNIYESTIKSNSITKSTDI